MPSTSHGTLQAGHQPPRQPHLATGLAVATTLGGGVYLSLWLEHPHRDCPVVPLAASAIVYLIAAIWHPAGRYLRNLHPVEDIVAYVRLMRAAPPIIRFAGECFHREPRRHWVIKPCIESDGKLHHREVPRDEWERVITLRPYQDFAFASWSDRSADLTEAIHRHQALCVVFRMIAELADAPTASAHAAARDAFITRFRHYDARFHFSEAALAAGFKPRMLSIVDMARKSPLLDFRAFVLFALLGLLAPYLLWFEFHTATGSFHLKRISTLPSLPGAHIARAFHTLSLSDLRRGFPSAITDLADRNWYKKRSEPTG